MFASIKKIRTTLTSPNISLEKRITYAMVLCAMLGEIFGFIESVLLKLSFTAILLPFVSFLILLVLSFWGLKTKHTRLFSALAISITGLIIFPLMLFANAGLNGGMPYYLLLVFVCTTLSLRGKTRILLFILLASTYSIIFAVYRFFPQFFIPMTPEDAFIDQLCSFLIAATILFIFSYTVSKQNAHDRKIIKDISLLYERQANTDELTGLYNRRYFNHFLKLAILTLGDTSKLHVAMFDIDNFKSVNDKYGHPFGDTVLKSFAAILAEREKIGATVCRYGGEEFLILIPKRDREEAIKIVEGILEETRRTIKIPEGKFITVSAGFITCTDEMTFEKMLQYVDKNLYIAKASGKNKVIY